ncbi:MAG: glutamate mutase L [Anaerolineae bacterium]|nr:glutamate mutase L [Anaerolineae bacterium]
MADSPTSILVADVGSAATKVGLVDLVSGEYRLVGATRTMSTVDAPNEDLMIGVRQGIMQLEALTGRRLLDAKNALIRPTRLDGDGSDAFVAVTSAALPLHAVVIGLSRDYSVACAGQAVNSTFAIVDHTIAVDEESGRWGTTASDGRAGGASAAVEKLATLKPDLVVMVGGIDGGAVAPLREMANIVAAVGAAMDEDSRPFVIFAGNHMARGDVVERIGGLMQVSVVDNVLPALDRANPGPLQAEIENLYRKRRIERLPGFDKLAAWAEKGVMTTADAFTRVTEYLARKYQLRVLGVDLGAGATTMVRADGNRTQRAVVEEESVGYGLDALLERTGIETIMRWLPTPLEAAEVHAGLLNQSVRPQAVPTRWQDTTALNAAGREILMHTADVWHDQLRSQEFGATNGHAQAGFADSDLVLLSGAPVARGSKPTSLLLMLLDALQVRGIFSVAADNAGLAAAMGAVAAVNSEAAAQALENDCLVTWGTVFVPDVVARAGEPLALVAHVEPARGGKLEADVKLGSLELIPLGEGEKANVELRAGRGVSWGPSARGNIFKREVQGGTVGVMIDARGRPLPMDENMDRQRERMQRWMWEAGA